MPRSHRPRKRYIPKRVRLDSFEHAADRVALLQPDQRAALAAPVDAALAAFRAGRGCARAWCDLADALNVGEALAHARIGGAPLLPVFAAGQAALAAVHARHAQRRSWTLRGAEITALDDACHWARWQLEQASQGEVRDAVDLVQRRSAGALAGGVAPDTTVLVGLLGRPEPATLTATPEE